MLPESLRAKTTVLANGETKSVKGVSIEAVPMYNTTPERLQYHTKGRGNGYVVTLGGKRVYISGDTEDIPEMRALKNIDVAFVCFNLPYTMTEEQAASAVRDFAPKIVYPYHYRGSDIAKFKKLVGNDAGIEVREGSWY
jgi:L-ascorbate metabolism protein UlaG (beta-lactamase superfamily)